MREFNIVTEFNVSLFNRRPLAVGMIYGKIDGVTYTFQPVTGELCTHCGAWGKMCENSATIDKIWAVLNRKRSKWPVSIRPFDASRGHDKSVKATMRHTAECASRPHVVEGAPVRREVQRTYTRYKGSCYSQRAIEGKMYTTCEYEEKVRDVVVYDEGGPRVINSRGDSYRGYERPYDYKKPMEVGQNTAGPEQFLSKRNGMYAHDVQKGKDNKKEERHVGELSKSAPRKERTTEQLRSEVKNLETDRSRRLNDCGSTSRPSGHIFFTDKAGGNAVRKVIHGEQV